MSEPIGPGDFVECINRLQQDPFTLGGIYRVKEVIARAGPCSCHGWNEIGGLLFCEVEVPTRYSGGYAWCARNFRPVYRPKASLIEYLKNSVPTELEDA